MLQAGLRAARGLSMYDACGTVRCCTMHDTCPRNGAPRRRTASEAFTPCGERRQCERFRLCSKPNERPKRTRVYACGCLRSHVRKCAQMCEGSAVTWTTVALNFAQSEKNDDAENLRLTISVAPISSAAAIACASAWITLRCACQRPSRRTAHRPTHRTAPLRAPATRCFRVRP